MDKAIFRQARQSSGLTQEQAATMLGISERHMRRLESGQTPITESLGKLASLMWRIQ